MFIMNKKAIFSIPILACCLTSCTGTRHYEVNRYELPLEWKDTTKDFRILQLVDIHLSQSNIFERHFKILNKTIKDANPNLIILNGDSFTYADKGVVIRLFSFIDSYDIPWTFTFGNHDDQGYFSDTYIQRILAKEDLFKNVKWVNLEDDDVTGRSNFMIDIFKKEDIGGGNKKDVSAFQVYCLESHSYNFDTIEYDYIKQDQVDWYQRMVEAQTAKNGGVKVPSAMYFHIPVPEFFNAWNDAIEGKPNAEIILGTTDELGGGPLPSSDTHIFDKVKELGSTIAISSAHDHINDSVIKYNDITLCFGVHSTDRIYYDKAKIGGQVIVVDHTNPWNLKFENIKNSYEEVEDK